MPRDALQQVAAGTVIRSRPRSIRCQ
jgi:hypothetical protein